MDLVTFPDLEESEYWLSSHHERYNKPRFSWFNWLLQYLKKKEKRHEKMCVCVTGGGEGEREIIYLVYITIYKVEIMDFFVNLYVSLCSV